MKQKVQMRGSVVIEGVEITALRASVQPLMIFVVFGGVVLFVLFAMFPLFASFDLFSLT